MWIFGKTYPVEKNKMGKIFGKRAKILVFLTNECSNVERCPVENPFFSRFLALL